MEHWWSPAGEVAAPVLPSGPSRPISFDNIFNGPPAYWTAGVDLPLQLQAAAVAQAHVSTCVDDCVHVLVEANGAFSIFSNRGQL